MAEIKTRSNTPTGLDYRSAIAKIRQERSDVGKALSAAQVNLASDLSKKGTAAGTGSSVGAFLGPILGDYLVGSLLNFIAPGVGSIYQTAKNSPLLKGAGTAAYAYGGSKLGGEIGSSQVDVRDVTPQVTDYLGETISGSQAMRFDRGATESLELQKDEQLKVLDDLINQRAITDAGSSFLKSVTKDMMKSSGDDMKKRLDAISATRELTSQDYMDALSSASSDRGFLDRLINFQGIDSPTRGVNPSDSLPTNMSSQMMSLNYEKQLADLQRALNVRAANAQTEEINYGGI